MPNFKLVATDNHEIFMVFKTTPPRNVNKSLEGIRFNIGLNTSILLYINQKLLEKNQHENVVV